MCKYCIDPLMIPIIFEMKTSLVNNLYQVDVGKWKCITNAELILDQNGLLQLKMRKSSNQAFVHDPITVCISKSHFSCSHV